MEIIGRRRELARIEALLGLTGTQPADTPAALLVLTGERGSGRTALLEHAVRRARSSGRRVVHEPLGAAGVVGRLLAALGAEPAPADPVSTRTAVLTALDRAARLTPVLVAVDDVTDPDDVAVLAFAARRLRSERVALLITTDDRRPAAAGPGVCRLDPLDEPESARLLDALDRPPRGHLREEILRWAAGHPLTLRDLAAASQPTGTLTLTPRSREVAAPARDLPAATRRLLRCAAAADGEDLDVLLRAAGAEVADCAPAEEAHLISVAAGRLVFRHPLLPAVLNRETTPEERRAVHARLAAALPAGPAHSARAAWHRAEAGEGAAADYERAGEAPEAERRYVRAAEAFVRAAEVSTDPADAARRYGRAATEAARTGALSWCEELWERTVALTDDPVLLAAAGTGLAYRLLMGPHENSLGLMERLLATGTSDQSLNLLLLSMAATAVNVEGDPTGRAVLGGLIERTVAHGERGDVTDDQATLLAWAQAVADPAGWPRVNGPFREWRQLRPGYGTDEPARSLSIGGTAWVLGHLDVAADHLRRGLTLLREQNDVGTAPGAFRGLADVLIELGRWAEAEALFAEAADVLGGASYGFVRDLMTPHHTMLLVYRGRLDAAAEEQREVARLTTHPNRLIRALNLHAAGQLAAARGDHDAATTVLLGLFEVDGGPVHPFASPFALADLAASARAAGRRDEVRPALAAARALSLAPHQQWIAEHAEALLADGDEAQARFARLVEEPVARVLPYRLARARAHYAEALHAARRAATARPLLMSALDTFTRLGATRDAESARARLRAGGVRSVPPGEAAGQAAGQAFERLTAQQQWIVRLAAGGLTNSAIAERLGLAPRTVGSHLYQIYPKLGVARRHQLPGLVPARAEAS